MPKRDLTFGQQKIPNLKNKMLQSSLDLRLWWHDLNDQMVTETVKEVFVMPHETTAL